MGSLFARFGIYVAIFIGLMVFLLNSLNGFNYDFNADHSKNQGETRIPFYLRELDKINITKSDLLAVLADWKFKGLEIDKTPLILKEDRTEADLKTTLISLLSRSVKNITPEQYAYSADLLGVYNLSERDRIWLSVLSPYNSFNLSFEVMQPNSPYNITYPPSADLSLAFKGSLIGDLRGYASYNGYDVKTFEKCECEFFSCYCSNYDEVTVRITEVYSFGSIRATHPIELKFSFPREHRDCLSRDYTMIGFVSYFLEVRHCGPGNIRVSFDYDGGRISGNLKSYDVVFTGYHGEEKVNLSALCNYHIIYNLQTEEYFSFTVNFTTQVDKKDWRWVGKLPFTIFGGMKTNLWCTYYVQDNLNIQLGNESLNIPRQYTAGSLWYYYVPTSEGVEERIYLYPEAVPEWAKRKFEYNPENITTAEEFMLRLYAEAARRGVENITKEELNEIQNKSLWKSFFGNEDFEGAKRILEYFYLVQIPLNIKINSSVKNNSFEAFIAQEGNESVVSSLFVFFENTTFIYPNKEKINFYPYGGKNKTVDTYLILVLTGSSNFTPRGLNSSCGIISLAELAYYRQPGLQEISKDLIDLVPDQFEAYRGYSPIPGVEFMRESKSCSLH